MSWREAQLSPALDDLPLVGRCAQRKGGRCEPWGRECEWGNWGWSFCKASGSDTEEPSLDEAGGMWTRLAQPRVLPPAPLRSLAAKGSRQPTNNPSRTGWALNPSTGGRGLIWRCEGAGGRAEASKAILGLCPVDKGLLVICAKGWASQDQKWLASCSLEFQSGQC